MKHLVGFLALIIVGSFVPGAAFTSGSLSAGSGANPRDAYTQGKVLTFKKLVCASCPIQRGELDRARAQSLKTSLEARDADTKPGTPDDEHIQVLCPGSRGVGCADKPDEQGLVYYYLTRRYQL